MGKWNSRRYVQHIASVLTHGRRIRLRRFRSRFLCFFRPSELSFPQKKKSSEEGKAGGGLSSAKKTTQSVGGYVGRGVPFWLEPSLGQTRLIVTRRYPLSQIQIPGQAVIGLMPGLLKIDQKPSFSIKYWKELCRRNLAIRDPAAFRRKPLHDLIPTPTKEKRPTPDRT